jgi:hypothetical protein
VILFYIESHWIRQNTWKPIVCCLFSGCGINAFRMASSNSSLVAKSCACAYIGFLAGIFFWYADRILHDRKLARASHVPGMSVQTSSYGQFNKLKYETSCDFPLRILLAWNVCARIPGIWLARVNCLHINAAFPALHKLKRPVSWLSFRTVGTERSLYQISGSDGGEDVNIGLVLNSYVFLQVHNAYIGNLLTTSRIR